MSEPSFATRERQALADELLRVGPDAPTLCEGWDAADLAAHLWVRDNQQPLMAGAMVPPLHGITDWAMSRASRKGFAQLVADVRQGPVTPVSVFRIGRVNDLANAGEMFIHLEDVRRANGQTAPRALAPEDSETLWRQACGMARMQLRGCPVGVALQRVGDRPVTVHAGNPMVTLVGAPGELLLALSGRREVAQVEVHGDPNAIEQFEGFHSSL